MSFVYTYEDNSAIYLEFSHFPPAIIPSAFPVLFEYIIKVWDVVHLLARLATPRKTCSFSHYYFAPLTRHFARLHNYPLTTCHKKHLFFSYNNQVSKSSSSIPKALLSKLSGFFFSPFNYMNPLLAHQTNKILQDGEKIRFHFGILFLLTPQNQSDRILQQFFPAKFNCILAAILLFQKRMMMSFSQCLFLRSQKHGDVFDDSSDKRDI